MSDHGARKSPERSRCSIGVRKTRCCICISLLGLVEGRRSASANGRPDQEAAYDGCDQAHHPARIAQPAVNCDIRSSIGSTNRPRSFSTRSPIQPGPPKFCCGSTIVWNTRIRGVTRLTTLLRLDPLGRESVQEMLSALLGNGNDLLPLRRLIIERTEGTLCSSRKKSSGR